MPVFDKDLNHLNVQDVQGSLQTLESYISYMKERLEFSNTLTTKTLSAAGTSTETVVLVLNGLKNTVQSMQSEFSSLQGNFSSLNTTISNMNTTISGLQSAASALEGRVTALENKSSS